MYWSPLRVPGLSTFVHGICGGESSSGGRGETTTGQHMLKRGKNSIDILTRGIVAHQADAKQMPFEGTKATANFDVVLFEQFIAYGHLVYPCWQGDCGHNRESVAPLGEDAQAHCFNTGFERVAVQLMACPARF